MRKFKNSVLFALALVPIAVIAAYFTILYQVEFLDTETLALILEQVGGMDALIAVYIVQIVVYTLFCGFVGHLLAGKLGLMKPIRFEKKAVVSTVVLSVICGILFSLDYWTFGSLSPGIQEADAAMLNWNTIAACVLYGGIIEEVMLRLFFMSLTAWLIWRIFFRKREVVPTGVLIAGNMIAAILFAAAHLPATVQLLGTLTPLIVFRCFLLNGGFGLLFGRLYRRYGIQYAMISHALLHIVSKAVWIIFT